MRTMIITGMCAGFVALLAGCSTTAVDAQPGSMSNDEEYVVAQEDFVAVNDVVDAEAELSQAEKDGLILMREEEKLAHDVYTTLHEKWGQRIFGNIAASEQTHTNAVKTLLDRYGIPDPVTTDAIGVFIDPEMQNLYDTLTQQGSESLLAALIVGATVEDLDIKDLDELLAQTDNPDITRVYENLQRGSRNHMRAFVRQITNNDGTYEAQYISAEDLEEILNSPQERGNGGGRGDGSGRGNGGGIGHGRQ